MERDNECEGKNNEEVKLKEEREAITPGEDTWNNVDSDDSMASSEEEDQPQMIITQKVEAPSVETPKIAKRESREEYRERSDLKLISMDYNVDQNYLQLLNALNRIRIINVREIAALKDGDVYLKAGLRKMVVRAASNEEAEKAIERISDYIDKLSVIKLNIKGYQAQHALRFKNLKADFLKNKIVILPIEGPGMLELQLGGEMRPSELRAHAQKINNMKVRSFYLRAYRNKRTYRVIISEILNTDYLRQAFKRVCLVSYAEVDPKHDGKELRVAVGSLSNKDLTPNQYEDFMMKQMESFYVLIFCFESNQRYLEKLKCENVRFRFITQRKFNRSYLLVIALKEDFLKRQEEIAQQIAKIGPKIMGVRLFYRIQPELKRLQFQKEKFYFFKFPEQRPYSTVITARRNSGYTFDWRDYFKRVLELQ